jgi:hypothetical protein
MVMFDEFIEKKYSTKKYLTEKSAEEKIKKTRSRRQIKITPNKLV